LKTFSGKLGMGGNSRSPAIAEKDALPPKTSWFPPDHEILVLSENPKSLMTYGQFKGSKSKLLSSQGIQRGSRLVSKKSPQKIRLRE